MLEPVITRLFLFQRIEYQGKEHSVYADWLFSGWYITLKNGTEEIRALGPCNSRKNLEILWESTSICVS